MLRVVICISTLHRPEGLGRILRSLAAQTARMLETVDLRVVVANNDPDDPRPTSVADEVRRATDLAVEVLHEARRGAILRPPCTAPPGAGKTTRVWLSNRLSWQTSWLCALPTNCRETL